jgi:hypothetical protein
VYNIFMLSIRGVRIVTRRKVVKSDGVVPFLDYIDVVWP